MRINAGRHKGQSIEVPKSNVEPTKEMVKEALFSIIGDDINNKSFLDLFAGSGNIGIEALSRGSKELYIVDYYKPAIEVIIRNLKHLKLDAKVIQKDVFRFLKDKELSSFDFIFADPPYNFNYYDKLVIQLLESLVTKSSTIIIVEHRKKNLFKSLPDKLHLYDRRKYGITFLSFFNIF